MSIKESVPKVFLSYAWGDADYDDRVVKLAEDLVRSRVEVVFDKWHLEEGQDAYDFMERTVKDSSVSQVLVLCEPLYAEKADDRKGGVGTETLIISPQVYRDAQQVKFIPVIMERNSDGSVAVPTYMDGRKYIDLSNPATEVESFTRLVRRLWGKPELVPPPLGEKPAYLDDTRPQLLTGRSLEQYKDAVRRGRLQATGYLDTYLEHLLDAYRAETIAEDVADTQKLAQLRDASIERFIAYRDEFVDGMRFIARFTEDGVTFDRVHRFFEELINARFAVERGKFSWEERTENLSFIARELILYAVAILLNEQRFTALDRMLRVFLVRTPNSSAGNLRGVAVLDSAFPLMRRNYDPFYDPVAELLARRATTPRLPYEALTEAELYLSLRSYFETVQVPFYGRMFWRSLGAGSDWDVNRLPVVTRLKDPIFSRQFLGSLGLSGSSALVSRLELEDDESSFPHPLEWLTRSNIARLFGIDLESQLASVRALLPNLTRKS